MVSGRTREIKPGEANHEGSEGGCPSVARSVEIGSQGVKTAADFAALMSALMSDLLSGRVTPQTGNAVVNAGGKLLKVVEMRLKYGTAKSAKDHKSLQLVEYF
jgi:hypothetical protein